MPVREKLSIRLDPEIVSLGRRLAKKDFGSEQKFGLLIENAIRSYHARQVQPIEASSLLSATEEALIARIEKRVEEMGTKTINRVGNLIAKSSYETAYSTIMLEQLYKQNGKKEDLDQFRNIAVHRMQSRFDKESANTISSLLEENKRLVTDYNQLVREKNALVLQSQEHDKQLAYAREKLEETSNILDQRNALIRNLTESEKRKKQEVFQSKSTTQELNRKIDHLIDDRERLATWTKGLLQYLETNSNGLIKKPASKIVEEYIEQRPRPKGV